ncbi:MAG: WD40 repeat domain-containing protein [Mariniblastus sp.]
MRIAISNLLVLATIYAVVFISSVCESSMVNAARTQAGESQARTQTSNSDQLPKHAVWRFGEHGQTPQANGIYRMAFSRDGKLLATRDRNFVLSIYDVDKQKLIYSVEMDEKVDSIDFSPDSEFVLTAGGGPKIKIWNARTGKLEADIETDGIAAYFNRLGTTINVLGETHVESYSWPGVQMTSQQKWKSNSNEVRSAMSRDGKIVVSYRGVKGGKFQTQVMDLTEKAKVLLGPPSIIPRSVVISQDRFWVAATYRDSKISLWNLRDASRTYSLRAHAETVQSIAFSADCRFLVSASWDKTVVAWDLLTRQPIGKFEGHLARVTASTMSPRDFIFASGASGTKDCSVIGWSLKDQIVLPSIKPAAEKLTVKDFEKIWAGLGASSINSSLRATSQLVYGESVMLDELAKRLPVLTTSGTSGTSGSVEELVRLLEHPEFRVRQKTTEQLIKIRAKIESKLKKLLDETNSPELKYRIGLVLKKKIARPIREKVETRRWGRIVFALEFINTPKSIELLTRIANGYDDVEIARDAMLALERIEAVTK